MRKKIIALGLIMFLGQAAWAQQASVQDPYKRYNRFMFGINDSLDRHVVTPVARGYRKITPSPVRTGVRNFFNNFRDVVSLSSNILRLDIEKAATDFLRIGINSTFGLGGLIDIADAGGVPDNKNTLGDTLSSWGWKNSHYFVYPLMGPSTVRDALGNTALFAYPVSNAVFQEARTRWGVGLLNGVQTRESLLDVTDSLNDAALDRYAYVRDMYMNMRNKEVGASVTASSDNDDIDIDSLVSADDDNTDANSTDTNSSPANNTVSGSPDTSTTVNDNTTPDKPDTTTEQPIPASSATTADTIEADIAAPLTEKYIQYWHVKPAKIRHQHNHTVHIKKHNKSKTTCSKKRYCHL